MREFNWTRGLLGGGILIGIMAFSFYPIISEHTPEPEVSYDEIYNCLPLPDDVPAKFASGTPIPWDCEMATFYKNGDLKLIYNKKGGLVAIQKLK